MVGTAATETKAAVTLPASDWSKWAETPLPVADSLGALSAADSLYERRDRVVESFRCVLRYVAALALAARCQFGAGPNEAKSTPGLLRSLGGRGLTDGQWVRLMRELLSAWKSEPDAHALPELARLFNNKKSLRQLSKAIDGLLEMRKSETVAHGATGTTAGLTDVLTRREPQLAGLLTLLQPLWDVYALACPTSRIGPDGQPNLHRALLLHGDTPRADRYRRIDLDPSVKVTANQVVVVKRDTGDVLLSLSPIAQFKMPFPGASSELFVLDGARRRAALFVAFPSMAELRDESAWDLLGERLFEDRTDGAGDELAAGRPYRGLSSFGPEHAELFFGRDDEASALANQVRRHPLVTVTGASGSGKSSLLFAGVVGRLAETYRWIVVRPGPAPMASLTGALSAFLQADQGTEQAGDSPELAPEETELTLLPDLSVDRLIELAVERCEGKGKKLLLVVDQAEEIFTLGANETQRDAFASTVIGFSEHQRGSTRVVISLREDYFARLATVDALSGRYNRVVEVVTTPKEEALAQTLTAPARAFGYEFADPDLVREMVTTVSDEPSALAMLQFCADQMWRRRDRQWKRLTADAYKAIGGVEGALATHAESVLSEMTPSQVAAARMLFLRLVTPERTRAVVEKAELLDSLKGFAGAPVVLERMVDARLLMGREAASESGKPSIELVHEALLGHWARLGEWLDADVEFARVRARVTLAARRWRDEDRQRDFLLADGKPLLEAEELYDARRNDLGELEIELIDRSRADRRRRRRLRAAAIAGLALLTVMAGAFGVFAWFARARAEKLAVVAENNAKSATEKTAAILTGQGRRELFEGEPLRALPYLLEAKKHVAPGSRDSEALELLLSEARSSVDAVDGRYQENKGRHVSQAVFGPDAKRVALALNPGAIRLFDVASHRQLRAWDVDKGSLGIRFLAGGKTLLVERNDRDFVTLNLNQNDIAQRRGAAASSKITTWHYAGGWLVVARGDRIELWRMDENGFVDEKPHRTETLKELKQLALSADGGVVSALAASGQIRSWRTEVKGTLASLSHDYLKDDGILRLALDRTGERLLVVSKQGFRVLSEDETRVIPYERYKRMRAARFVDDGKAILATSYANSMMLWSTAEKRPLMNFGGHKRFGRGGKFTRAGVTQAVYRPANNMVFSRGSDDRVRAWDARTGHVSHVWITPGQVRTMAVDPSGTVVVLADENGEVQFAHLPAGRHVRTASWSHGRHKVSHLSMSRSGKDWLFSNEQGLALHRGGEGAPRRLDSNCIDANVSLSSDGKTFAAICPVTGQPKAPRMELSVWWNGNLKRYPFGAAVTALFVSTSKQVVVGLKNGHVVILSSGEERDFAVLERPVVALDVGPDGKYLAVAARGLTAVVNLESGTVEHRTPEPSEAVNLYPRVAVRGRQLLSASSSLSVDLWDFGGEAPRLRLEGELGVFAPDGKRIATVDRFAPIARVTDATTGEVIAHLDGHEDKIKDLRFFGDNRLLTAGRDGEVRLWDLATSTTLLKLYAHRHGSHPEFLAFDSAKQFVTTSTDGFLRFWSVAERQPSSQATRPMENATLADRIPWELRSGRLLPVNRTAEALPGVQAESP